MPHEELDEKQAANYLHLNVREIEKLASRGKLSCHKARSKSARYTFRKSDLDHWVESQMHKFDHHRFIDIEKGVTSHHGFDVTEMTVCPNIPDDGIALPLNSRTREGVLRDLVAIGDRTDMVWDCERVLDEVREREDLCSTALVPGVAMPHPHHPLEYDIAQSFVVVGLAPSGVPFGAEDGSLTRMFFLVCCKDDRTHLHILSRLAGMLHMPGIMDDLLDSADPEELFSVLLRAEKDLISTHHSG